jgi:hypothetical protein
MHCGAYNFHKSKSYNKNSTKVRREEMEVHSFLGCGLVQHYLKADFEWYKPHGDKPHLT